MPNNFSTVVVKYGGNAMGPELDDAVLEDVAWQRAAGRPIVLVHGGGPAIDNALAARSIATARVDGLRVTDAAALEVIEAVLCASANKHLVRACLRLGIAAVGISGQDGALLKARRMRSPTGADLGFVGEIVSVDPAPLLALTRAGFLPIVSPVAVATDGSCAYNVNADSAAAAIAAALDAYAYVALTNVERVRRVPGDPTSAIDRMSLDEATAFAESSACVDGMRPKMLAAIAAVRGGAVRSLIAGAKPFAISRALAGDATEITLGSDAAGRATA